MRAANFAFLVMLLGQVPSSAGEVLARRSLAIVIEH
jgi:hypothetical protein